jgi:hypothetical protein
MRGIFQLWKRLLMACGLKKRKIVGQGKLSSGIRDIGSNKKHLRGFGR